MSARKLKENVVALGFNNPSFFEIIINLDGNIFG